MAVDWSVISIIGTIIAAFVGLAGLLLRISTHVHANTRSTHEAAKNAAVAITRVAEHEKLCDERGKNIEKTVTEIRDSLNTHIKEEDNNVKILKNIQEHINQPKPKHFWQR